MLIGAHVSSAGGIDKAIDRAVELEADSVQVFTQSPRAWRPTNHDPATLQRALKAQTNLYLKSVVPKGTCRFESDGGHHTIQTTPVKNNKGRHPQG